MLDVVVINHDPDVLEALAAALEDDGLTVAKSDARRSAEELANLVREQDPRVVVYDLGPPPVDPAVEKWRNLCQQPGARRPYVITTTYPCQFDPHPCAVECVLLKPMTFDDVNAAVRRAMQVTLE